MSFMIVVGWALLFIGLGVITGNAWFTSIGTAVVTFWTFFPISPMWLTIIGLALLFQRFVLGDKSTLTGKQVLQSIKDGGLKDGSKDS